MLSQKSKAQYKYSMILLFVESKHVNLIERWLSEAEVVGEGENRETWWLKEFLIKVK